MATIDALRAGPRLRLTGNRPELWLDAISAGCWLGLVSIWATDRDGGHHAGGVSSASPALAQWVLMVGAMMLPVLTPRARLIALRGLRQRRHQAIAAFAVGYLAAWTFAGGVLIMLVRVTGLAGIGPVVLCLLMAAAWHCAPPRRSAVRQCGRLPTLALTGVRAHLDCVTAGALAGRSALWTCGPAMSAMCFVHAPVLALGIAGVLLAENRAGPNPEQRIGSAAQAGGLVMLAGLVALTAGWPIAAGLL